MSKASITKQDIIWYLHVAVILVLMFGFPHLPPFGALTPAGMQVVGIFLGLMYGWSMVSIIWPSLLGFLALAFSEVSSMKEMMAASFSNDTFMFLIFVFAFLTIIEESGVSQFFASWTISRKILQGRPWLFSYVLLVSCYFVSSFISVFAAIFVFWSIIYSVAQRAEYKPYSPYPTIMIMGVIVVAGMSTITLPFKGGAVFLVNAYNAMSGLTIDFAKYIAYTIPVTVFLLGIYILACRFILRIDISALKEKIDPSLVDAKDLNLDRYQKTVLFFLVLMLFMLMGPTILPKDFILTQVLRELGMTGTMMVLVIITLILRFNHKPFMDFNRCAAKNVKWDTLIIVAVIIPVATLMSAESTGIKAFLANLISPLLAGHSPLFFIILLIAAAGIFTNICNNGVVALILISVLLSVGEDLGLAPTPIAITIMLIVQMAMVTPAASPFAAILFGNTEWIRPTDVYKYGSILLICLLIGMVFCGIVWNRIIY